jgi:hypothetical protein
MIKHRAPEAPDENTMCVVLKTEDGTGRDRTGDRRNVGGSFGGSRGARLSIGGMRESDQH